MTFAQKIVASVIVGTIFGVACFFLLILVHAFVYPFGAFEEIWLVVAGAISLMLTGFVARDFYNILKKGSRYEN